jgi:hypothetical protein
VNSGNHDVSLKAIREAFENLPPEPTVDRACVHDMRALHDFPKREARPMMPGQLLPEKLMGIPVMVDPQVEVGVIEFRKGDKLVRSFHLAELRA